MALMVLAAALLLAGLAGGAGGAIRLPASPTWTPAASAAGQARSGAITATTVASTSSPAPLSSGRVGIWYSPAPDQYTPAALWKFDPVSHSVPSGFRTDHVKVGTLAPYPASYPFTYSVSGATVTTDYPSGHRGTITLLSYSSSQGVLQVDWEGYPRVWYSCASAYFPAAYRVYC
ncbi:hypothetical protein [Frankia sp. AgB32]|uniref:hypothetical protein n=1 Tax=Frankia sp. AgB32 TaxID=631119 RepID=UPI00200D5AF1|nr:hypothetical protein [Frankia sp. AgB32]MCK9896855.1 hypothetical protein [Frankia sp. AgB32]